VNGAEWAVVIVGLGLIGWINWYFFLAGRSSPSAADGAGRDTHE